jgi:hypothetical protein
VFNQDIAVARVVASVAPEPNQQTHGGAVIGIQYSFSHELNACFFSAYGDTKNLHYRKSRIALFLWKRGFALKKTLVVRGK